MNKEITEILKLVENEASTMSKKSLYKYKERIMLEQSKLSKFFDDFLKEHGDLQDDSDKFLYNIMMGLYNDLEGCSAIINYHIKLSNDKDITKT